MNPVMYIILNKGAKMSTGKAAAQAAHAAVLAYDLSPDDNTKRVWWRGGHYTKIVLEASDAAAMLTAQRYIAARGFKTAEVIDEGRTEVDPLTPTAVGVQIVDKDDAHVAATFSTFKLYSDEPPRVLIWEHTGQISRDVFLRIMQYVDDGDYETAQALLRYSDPCSPKHELADDFYAKLATPVQKGPVSDDPDHRSNSGNTSRRRSGTS